MAVPVKEINLVVKVLNDPEFDGWTEKDLATKIVEAINQERENTKRFVVVASLKWPHDDDHHMWAAGPFNTERQAEQVGEKFSHDPYTKRGEGRWKVVPILSPAVNPARTAWDTIRPAVSGEPCCSLHHGWIKDDLDRWTWLRPPGGADHWREGW